MDHPLSWAPPLDDDLPPEAEDELARKFVVENRGKLRYVAAWGKWLVRDPAVWKFDETLLTFDLARKICRVAARNTDDEKLARQIASARTVAAVEKLARSDRNMAGTTDEWDSDPFLLNTPGGVVDLRTGATLAHRDDDFVTKITAAKPGGDCPLWLKFLDRITGGSRELQSFLQRVAGYSLTGVTNEHALFFGHGTGRNGKGVLLNTLTGIMGSYATVAPMETFTASANERHPTDLAMLRGARLVTAQETEEGRKWAEAKIKALTGGDPITARFMRQDFFTFTPQFKLFIAGNHKPSLSNVDEAIKARFHLVPFNVTIPKTERDPHLSDKLKTEWPGILKWAIQGCIDWQSGGLEPPAIVRAATDDYLDAEDALGLWLKERCKRIGYGGTESTRLFGDWCEWAKARREESGSQKRFSQALEGKGFTKDPKARIATFSGIALDDVRPTWSETQADRA